MTTPQPNPALKVCVVAEHASVRFGGEAILPYHYFKRLRERGVEAWMVVHARTRDELLALMPDQADRISFIPDTALHKVLWAIGRRLPASVRFATTGFLLRLFTQFLARRHVRRLVRDHGINIVHEPIPVSPRNPSMMFGVGAPVVIGPMNGGMNYPPAFKDREKLFERAVTVVGRSFTNVTNLILPGKRRAALVLVANPRTRDALPAGLRGEVLELVENGVDLGVWHPVNRAPRDGPTRFVFLGRLMPLKAVDLLLEAFAPVAKETGAVMYILGDGAERARLEAQAADLGISGQVVFTGFVTQAKAAEQMRASDVFVLSSLNECGGAVVLEAMACSLPVIVTNWGGPADYVTDECGILVEPAGREVFVAALTDAMRKLEHSPELRHRLGDAGRRRIREAGFDWEDKISRILELYRSVVDRSCREELPQEDLPRRMSPSNP